MLRLVPRCESLPARALVPTSLLSTPLWSFRMTLIPSCRHVLSKHRRLKLLRQSVTLKSPPSVALALSSVTSVFPIPLSVTPKSTLPRMVMADRLSPPSLSFLSNFLLLKAEPSSSRILSPPSFKLQPSRTPLRARLVPITDLTLMLVKFFKQPQSSAALLHPPCSAMAQLRQNRFTFKAAVALHRPHLTR